MKYPFLLLKRMIEDIFIFPFILIGRLISIALPLSKSYRIFFFFPFYHTGGAEKVHYQVVQATGGKDCIIFFTRKSDNNSFLQKFSESGCNIKNISKWTDNKWFYFLNLIYRGIISGYINGQKQKPVVFNGQCNFGYKLSPWINKKVRQIELIHSFNTFSYIRLPFLPFISETVMISKKRIEDHIHHYKKINVPSQFVSKINYIPNAIHLPETPYKKNDSNITVLYAGRGGKEKRIHLIAAIAKTICLNDPAIKFEILGDVSNVLDKEKYPYIKFHGNVHNETVINDIYSRTNILILTSDTEGFPMVIIEAMAYGCAIISTPVGDIPYHIKNDINGFLFTSITDEKKIIEEGVSRILELQDNPQLINSISKNNINYSKHNFDIEKFNTSYRQLLK